VIKNIKILKVGFRLRMNIECCSVCDIQVLINQDTKVTVFQRLVTPDYSFFLWQRT